jgi:hypothetical protein
VNDSCTNYHKHAQNVTNAIAKEHSSIKLIAKGCAGPHMLEISEALRSQALDSSRMNCRTLKIP